MYLGCKLLCAVLLAASLGAQEHKPSILYSSYLGGSGSERGSAIAVDKHGDVYVAGVTTSADFPTTDGAYRGTVQRRLGCDEENSFSLCAAAIFVAKISGDGHKLLWSTYLYQGFEYGFNVGVGVDDVHVNANGEVYITGSAGSGFPTSPGSLEPRCFDNYCAFIARLSADGSALRSSTFMGNGVVGMIVRRIRLDARGNVVIAGDTFSSVAFVALLDPALAKLSWVKRLGGTGGEQVGALEVTPSGIYVGGFTSSRDFPATQGAYQQSLQGEGDGFVSKLSFSGESLLNALLGGSGLDSIEALQVESNGTMLVAGTTQSSDFPISPNAYQQTFGGGLSDGFLAALNANGSVLLFSTYIGGSGDPSLLSHETVRGIGRMPDGSLQVLGSTNSGEFPAKNSIRLKDFTVCGWRPCTGLFVASLDDNASTLLGSTVFGSRGDDSLSRASWGGHSFWITGEGHDGFPTTADGLQQTENFEGWPGTAVFVTHVYSGMQDFQLLLESSLVDMKDGNGAANVSLTPAPAFWEPISLTCEGLPAGYECIFDPSTVTLGDSPQRVQLRLRRQMSIATTSIWPILAATLLGCCLGVRNGPRKNLTFISLVLVLGFIAGCRGLDTQEKDTMQISIVGRSSTVTHSASQTITFSRQ